MLLTPLAFTQYQKWNKTACLLYGIFVEPLNLFSAILHLPYSRLEFLSYWEMGWRVLLNLWVVLCSASILKPFSWLGFEKTLACPWLAEPVTLILCTRSPKFYHKWHPILNKIFDFCALSLIKSLESPTPHIGASWIPIPCQGVVSKDIRI